MTYYVRRFFHVIIIANLFLFFSGCGYKAPPVYQNGDKNHQYLSKNGNINKVRNIANI